ncbi:peptide deformylase [Streptomyces sp. NPDC050560]|uniref:peptide deformylase n=1 Tax=Streptomyces sp. NPDC050560 TaxID=3365630 RepID=UPI0037AAA981
MRHAPIPGATGRVRPLVPFADPVLRGPCAPVAERGAALGRLVEDMFATMYAARGVGLAANQVGVALRVFVYDCQDDDERRRLGHVVNPVLESAEGVLVGGPEGCLSLPGVEAVTPRFDRAVVTGTTLAGEPVELRGEGYFARCLQHECDHLDGAVYTERVGGWRRRRVERAAARAWRAGG